MATKITHLDHEWGLSGATERRLCERPNGDLWTVVHTGGRRAKFFRSQDQGATWWYSGYSDIDLGQWSSILAFHIDQDGHAHIAWTRWETSPQVVRYAHGVPSSSGSGFHWRHLTVAPAGGRINLDADVIAFRIGGTRHIWLYWGLLDKGHRLSKLWMGSSNNPHIETTVIDPGNSAGSNVHGGLEFAHVGDGVTPSATPHLFLTTASFWDVPGGEPDIRLHRATYQSGGWTFTDSVLLEQRNVPQSTIVSVYDGELLCCAWAPDLSPIRFATWPGTGLATRNDPPATPVTGEINGLTMSHDPGSDDIFLALHTKTDGDIWWTWLRRSTGVWDAWKKSTERRASSLDNKVQALRHPRNGNIDVLYADYDPANHKSGTLYHERLVALSRKPGIPALRSPANGTLGDFNAGSTFEWSYTPAHSGDAQQAWQFRRRYGTATEFWNNGAQAWSATEVWNTGPTDRVSFGPGFWPPSTTYAWAVRTRSASGVDSEFSSERTIVSTTAPIVRVVAPTGLLYNESTPLVRWEYEGLDAQRDYLAEVIRASDGVVLWSSGTVTSSVAREVQVGESLPPDVSLYAQVTVTSTAGLSGAPDSEQFSLSLTPPAGPLVGVVDELTYPSDVPVARLDIAARSNYLEPDQAYGQAKWVTNANADATFFAGDLNAGLEPSLRLASLAAGDYSAITDIGSPPAVPNAAGVEQLRGPVSFPVLSGESYTAVAHFNPVQEARAGRVVVAWLDSDLLAADGTPEGTVISYSTGEQVVLKPGSYVKAAVSASAPDGAKLGRLMVEVLGGAAAGEVTYVTRMSFHPGLVQEWQPGGFSQTQTIRVERSDDGGATWSTILPAVKTDFWQIATAYDREAPLGRRVEYRAYTDVDLGSGARLSSDLSPTAVATIESPAWVLRDSTQEDDAIFAYVVGHSRSDTEQAVAHRPAGREYPVIDSEGPQSAEGSLTMFVPQHRIEATVEMLRRPVPLLVQAPDGKIFKARFLSRDYAVEALRHRMITANYYEVQ